VSRLFEQSKPRNASPRKGQQLPEQVRQSTSRPVKLQTVSCWQLEEPSMTGAPARCDVLEGVLSIFTPQDTASPTNPAQLSNFQPRDHQFKPIQLHPRKDSIRHRLGGGGPSGEAHATMIVVLSGQDCTLAKDTAAGHRIPSPYAVYRHLNGVEVSHERATRERCSR
jgi:hypothetical protein